MPFKPSTPGSNFQDYLFNQQQEQRQRRRSRGSDDDDGRTEETNPVDPITVATEEARNAGDASMQAAMEAAKPTLEAQETKRQFESRQQSMGKNRISRIAGSYRDEAGVKRNSRTSEPIRDRTAQGSQPGNMGDVARTSAPSQPGQMGDVARTSQPSQPGQMGDVARTSSPSQPGGMGAVARTSAPSQPGGMGDVARTSAPSSPGNMSPVARTSQPTGPTAMGPAVRTSAPSSPGGMSPVARTSQPTSPVASPVNRPDPSVAAVNAAPMKMTLPSAEPSTAGMTPAAQPSPPSLRPQSPTITTPGAPAPSTYGDTFRESGAFGVAKRAIGDVNQFAGTVDAKATDIAGGINAAKTAGVVRAGQGLAQGAQKAAPMVAAAAKAKIRGAAAGVIGERGADSALASFRNFAASRNPSTSTATVRKPQPQTVVQRAAPQASNNALLNQP